MLPIGGVRASLPVEHVGREKEKERVASRGNHRVRVMFGDDCAGNRCPGCPVSTG